MSIENNPAIEVLNIVTTTSNGNMFVLIVSVAIVVVGIAGICTFIVDWVKRRGSMDGFCAIIVATIIFCVIAGFNVYAMKLPVDMGQLPTQSYHIDVEPGVEPRWAPNAHSWPKP